MRYLLVHNVLHEHQQRTVESYLTLMALAPELPWAPVLTGQTPGDYARHVEMHESAGVALDRLPIVTVGALVGSPAKHQEAVIDSLAPLGLSMHGLGLKGSVLARLAPLLTSADSHSWSYRARRNDGRLCMDEHATHKDCRNCLSWALAWGRTATSALACSRQTALAL